MFSKQATELNYKLQARIPEGLGVILPVAEPHSIRFIVTRNTRRIYTCLLFLKRDSGVGGPMTRVEV